MDEYNEEAEFDYEDVIDCVKKYIERPKIKNIFLELDMSKKDIIKFADENLIDAEENEELVDYCKRLINFLAIIQVTKNYVKEIIEKDKKEKIENDEMEESKFLNSFSSAYEDGDVDKIIWLIIKYSKIPVEIEKDASGEIILTPAELTRYQAYIKSYQNDLSIELENCRKVLIKNLNFKSKKVKEDEEENIDVNKTDNKSAIKETTTVRAKTEEQFSHNKEYYKKFILTSKKYTENYLKKYPEDPKVILLFKKEENTIEEFFEAVRFYNKINSHIIAVLGKIKLKAKDYNSKEEMIEEYNKLLKNKEM